jgi:preprotein translocase subunit SecE
MAEPEPDKKRRVKNPETFRERAVKATEASDKPTKKGLIRSAGAQAVKPLAPVGRLLLQIFKWKPLVKVGRILRRIGKFIFPSYFRESWEQLRQVTWPTWVQSRQLTFAVLVFAVVFGAAIAVVDYGLDKLFRHLILK